MNQLDLVKAGYRYPVRLLLFWMLYFAVFRAWFVFQFRYLWSAEKPESVFKAFWYALPLDASTAAYLALFPVVLWYLFMLGSPGFQPSAKRIISVLNIILIALTSLILVSNIFLYREWQTLINSRAFEYLKTPEALFNSISTLRLAGGLSLWAALVFGIWKVHLFIVRPESSNIPEKKLVALVLPVWMGLMGLLIRGNFAIIPINESTVYYSKQMFNNHAATNPIWHLIRESVEKTIKTNPFVSMEQQKAQDLLDALGFGRPTAVANPILRDSLSQPNIVIVMMESMGAKLLPVLGGVSDICPNLNQIAKEGLLFDHCYSSGYRTEQGLVSLLAGYPAQPNQSIVLHEEKAAKLPSIPRVLKQQGYNTLYMYGGGLNFANIGTWIYRQDFDKVFSASDFQRAERTQKWGVDDDHMLQRAAKELAQMPQPYFATLTTLSAHPPFDVPGSKVMGKDVNTQFYACARFADDAIAHFMDEMKRIPSFENTLFVFVADHGYNLPGEEGQDVALSHHIPLVFAGPALSPKMAGRRISTVGNHHDLPATLLSALGYPTEDFYWSRNLLRSQAKNASAYYSYEDGEGWVDAKGNVWFHIFAEGRWYQQEGKPDEQKRMEAAAFLQLLYTDFLGR